ncbi:MAG: DoxX family protein [Burkholderiaceae bacterium]|nr:DoxX family protein [Burkholderiaceae bacterium]
MISGAQKLAGIDATQAYMLSKGVPIMLLPLVVALEIGGAAALMLGWKTRLFALAFAGFLFLTAVIFHSDFEAPMERILFLKDLALAGGFLLIFAHGPGELSLDMRKPIEG